MQLNCLGNYNTKIKKQSNLKKIKMNKNIILGIVVAAIAVIGGIYAFTSKSGTKACCKTEAVAMNDETKATNCSAENCSCEECALKAGGCDNTCELEPCCTKDAGKTVAANSIDAKTSCSNDKCNEVCTCGDNCATEGCECGCTACK